MQFNLQAPVSLAGALEEYIKDPNFEQNRVEYKANKQSADKSNGAPSLSSNNGSVSSKSKISFAEAKKPEKGMFFMYSFTRVAF